ncbi:MAG: CIA30 family protein [Ignavibacteriales bacterium]|nr:CIA30 family protein [Ignavibacteriales bacterium]
MIAIMYFILGGLIMNGEKQIFDFSSPETSGEWRIINDVVMGGVSKSSMKLGTNGTATFSGILSADNNGGFASVRTYVENVDVEGFKGVIIRTKGDGKMYNLRFRTDENYDGVSYQAKFKSEKEEWTENKIPFKDFVPTFRGRTVPNKPELNLKILSKLEFL